MSRRIDARFAALARDSRKALVPFVTAGDPEPAWTVALMHALVQSGADLLELGVPFSDPMADGPVIQLASERAISKGVDLAQVLEYVREFRLQDAHTPVVLMGYMNPIERFGAGHLAVAAAAAGVDGFLLVDCPPEEGGELQSALRQQGLACIRLVAPTTPPARLERICSNADGFIYYVAFKGITGADRLVAEALAGPIQAVRQATRLPIVAGFGISTPEAAQAVARHADGVVIGSALVTRLAGLPSEAATCAAAGEFVASVRKALDNDLR